MNETILCVDDEPNILYAIKRLFAHDGLQVMTTTSAAEALSILERTPVAVIISDNYMPAMTGIEFLQKAKELCPESVRIIITAYTDFQAAVDAINKGEVFRFVMKPWDSTEFREVVFSALDKHRVIHLLREADESTLRSLAQTIELKDPYTRGHCDRVAMYAIRIAKALRLPAETQEHIKYGSWLHDCGKIGIPETILNSSKKLSPEQMEVVRKHSRWGAEVVKLANLPETVIKIILHHHERFNGTGYPSGLKGVEIPLEARIVAIADVYDALTSDRPYRKKMPHKEAVELMTSERGDLFDPELLDIFLNLLEGDTIGE